MTIARAWGERGSTLRPGPKPSVTLTSVLDAGVRVGDTQGADALSLGRIASEVGLTTNALYRYVDSRDELVALLRDHALAEPPELEPAGWEDMARAWAHALRSRYATHPWLAAIPVRVPYTPHTFAWLDRLLVALSTSGLTPRRQLRAAALLDGYVRSVAVADADLAAGTELGPPADLERLLHERGLDTVAALVAEGLYAVPAAPPTEDEFGFGLDCLLAGLRAHIRTS